MGIRRKARELALNALYQSELTGSPPAGKFDFFCENFQANKKAIPYARELIFGLAGKWEEINALIEQNSEHWRLNRMSVIDRNIMRIAAFELQYIDDVPSSVAINEAIEIAKRFSTDDAAPFINGILDAVRKALET